MLPGQGEEEERPVSLRIDGRVPPPEAYARRLDGLIPGDLTCRYRFKFGRERALRIVGEHELRGGKGHEPRHQVPVLAAHQHTLIDGWVGADEDIRAPEMIADEARGTERPMRLALVFVAGGLGERRTHAVFHDRGEGSRIQDRDRAVPGRAGARAREHRSDEEGDQKGTRARRQEKPLHGPTSASFRKTWQGHCLDGGRPSATCPHQRRLAPPSRAPFKGHGEHRVEIEAASGSGPASRKNDASCGWPRSSRPMVARTWSALSWRT